MPDNSKRFVELLREASEEWHKAAESCHAGGKTGVTAIYLRAASEKMADALELMLPPCAEDTESGAGDERV